MDKVNNSRLKKPFLTRIDHIFIQPHRLFSKVQIQKKNDNLGKNGEKVVDADFRVQEKK